MLCVAYLIGGVGLLIVALILFAWILKKTNTSATIQSNGQTSQDEEWQRAKALAAAQRAGKPRATAAASGNQRVSLTVAASVDRSASGTSLSTLATRQVPEAKVAITVKADAPSADAVRYTAVKTTTGAMQWHPFGTAVRIAKGSISNGGFYSCQGVGPCTGAVDETLPIPAKAKPDWQAANVGYWPTYHQLTPHQRLAYLGYLSSSRRAKHIGQTYLWLYVYNLEYRLLVESTDSVPDAEFEVLIAELDALRQNYADLSAVRRYLPNMIAAARARRGVLVESGTPPLPMALTWDADIAMRAGLTFLAQQPISPEWALQIAILNRPIPRSHLDTIASELSVLFALRYAQLSDRGKLPKLGRSRLTIHYKRAMDGRSMEIRTAVPDIERLRAPFTPWIAVLDECLAELEPLRKARSSKAASPLAALAAYPHALASLGRLSEELAAARDALWQRCKSGPQVLPWSELVLSMGKPGVEAKKREVMHAAQALGAIGLGLEPDPRFGTGTPASTAEVVVFHLGASPSSAPSDAFSGALLLVQCALHVASSDGVSEQEKDATLALLARDLDLPPAEVARLEAHITLMSRDSAPQRRAINQLKTLPENERHRIARGMVSIAGADGHVDAAEVRLLERLYSAVGLPSEMLHHDIHTVLAGAGVSSSQATLAPASSETTGSIPRAVTAAPTTGLDEEVIARKLAETARVHSLLSTVFVEEAPEPEPVVGAEQDADVRLELARMLAAAAPSMDRISWEALCADRELLPDAALESVNELAVEMCGEPLADGDDPIEINIWAAGEMGLAAPQEEEA